MRRSAIGFTALISACTSIYSGPTSGPTASVSFPGPADVVSGYVVPDGFECDRSSDRWSAVAHRSGSSSVAQVPADVPIIFHYNHSIRTGIVTSGDIYSCNFQFRLIPRMGASYVVDNEISGDKCYLSVKEVQSDGAHRRIEPEIITHQHCPGGKWNGHDTNYPARQ